MRGRNCIVPLICSILLTGCRADLQGQLPAGKLVYEVVSSPSLAANLLGDSAYRSVLIYLPPSYGQAGRTFPVVYFLHGFDDTNTAWRDGKFGNFRLPESVDGMIGRGEIEEMILVFPDSRNMLGGSFYTDSPVTGNWETFIVHDLRAYIDQHYRTRSEKKSRGISGHSMGGYGAIYLAARHPDIFCCVWGISSATLALVGDVALEEEWRKAAQINSLDQLASAGNYARAYLALSAALSPHPGQPPFHADLPFRLVDGKLEPVADILRRWMDQFPADSLDRFESGFRALQAIGFDVGRSDQFSHIPAGSRLLDQRLSERGIPHHFEQYDGGHWDRVGERLTGRILPFFSQAFSEDPGELKR